MLLDFSVTNWKPFKEEASLNLVAGLERQHRETLATIDGFRTKKVLPIASIYGGNASGKTSFFDALAAFRHMVTHRASIDESLPVQPFLLDDASPREPTCFDITFLKDKVVYRYIVEATQDSIVYESLEIVRDRADNRFIYEWDSAESSFRPDNSYFQEPDRITYVFQGTRPNQLFLNNAVDQNVQELRKPYEWFSQSLVMYDTASHASLFASSIATKNGFIDFASRKLREFDTGISKLVGNAVDPTKLPLDAIARKKLSTLKNGAAITLTIEGEPGDYAFDMYVISSENGKPNALRLHACHEGDGSNEIPFELSYESSGTQRLMGMLPMLFDLENSDSAPTERVYVVDELDRCLHTMLTTHVVKQYLAKCNSQTRTQLLFTTHDLLLMDQSFMRRDEMYLAQRDGFGRSELIGLNEFEGIRHDKDLIKSYLEGRFGGIPMFMARD